MRQITAEITRAFEERRSLKIDNSRTDGDCLWLFENKIAEWRGNNLWITDAGWDSKTTKERLNGLNGVSVRQERGVWFLNGREWNGEWTNVWVWDGYRRRQMWELEYQAVAIEPEFDTTSEWMPEGYSRPVYSVFYTLVESRLEAVEALLTEAGIETKRMESDTAGMYRPNYFIVVHPDDVVKAVRVLLNN
jgi:hypothetical protein